MKWKSQAQWSLLCLLMLYVVQSFATDLAQQRKNFLYASEAIKKGQLDTYYRLKPQLTDYPLYPYLQYEEINQMMANSLPTEHVENFLTAYPDSSLAQRLQNNWLRTLAKQQQWALYQKFYTPADDTTLQCYAIWAEYKTTQNSALLTQAAPLWIQARSQPQACDPLFNAWQKSSAYTPAQAWERVQLAMTAQQNGLVTYLKRYLPAQQKTLADLWLKVQDNPASIASSSFSKNTDPFVQYIQISGMKRLINQDINLALNTWANIKDKYPFTAAQHAAISYAFAIQFSVSHDEKALTWLNAVPAAQADAPIYEWRVRYALRQQDWAATLRYINEMPAELKQLPLWRYWQGRALFALNQTSAAVAILEPLSQERNYHGMLASDLLNKPYVLNNRPYTVSKQVQEELKRDPNIIRARELFALNRIIDARREWDNGLRYFDEAKLQAAAQLAYSMQWYDRSVLTAAKAQNRDDLKLRFPLAYASEMKKFAAKQGISPAWAFAITRQESAFLSDARSSAGALGLMQLLPGTAAQVAKSAGLTHFSSAALLVPATNIALGTSFLKQMTTKFNHNPLLATAAYNAGPTRVYRWLPKTPMPTDIWVETIPFKETRHYVQNVFSYQVIYQDHLGLTLQRLNHHLTQVQP